MIEAIAAERHARDREIILEAGAKEDMPKVLRTLIDRFEKHCSIRATARGAGWRCNGGRRRCGTRAFSKSFARGVDEPRRMLAAIVTRARDNDEMPKNIDPDAMARVLIALFQGFALQLAWDPRIDPKPFANAIERLFAAILSRS